MSRIDEQDKVVKFLFLLNLLEQEQTFRGLLRLMESEGPKEMTIAVVATMMTINDQSSQNIALTLEVVRGLQRIPDEQFPSVGVTIINGSVLLLPTPGSDDLMMLDVSTLKPVETSPPMITMTVYGTGVLWEMAKSL